MKKIFLLSILSFIFCNSHSQSGWNYLPGSPSVVASIGRFDDLYFINDSTGWAVNGDGKIYKTNDYGTSWTLQLDSVQYYFRSVEFINDTVGFAGTFDSVVFKTTDAGATWFHIEQTFPVLVPGVCGIGHFGNTVIMEGIWSSPAYLLRSTDGGNTWTYINLDTLAGALIDCWFLNQDTVFVCGQKGASGGLAGVILRSTDGGVTWQKVGQSLSANSYCWKIQFTSDSIGYSSLEEFTAFGSHILKTTDGGATWTHLTVSNVNINMEGIGFLNDTVGWVGGWSIGMYETYNGAISWNYVTFGENLNRFVFRHPNLAYAAGLGIYKFTGITTGISENTLTERYVHQLEIFPNPATDDINFKLHINKNTTAIFDVYDLNGKLLKNFAHGRMEKKEYAYKWDITHLAKGEYFAVLRTNEHFLTKKFMVK